MGKTTVEKETKAEPGSDRIACESSNWRVLNGIGLAVFIGLVWTMSRPGISRMSLLMAVGGFVVASVWTLYVIRLHRKPARMSDVVVVPLLVVAFVVLTMWSLPLKARFALSKTSFEAVIEEIAPQSGDGLGDSSSADPGAHRLGERLRPDGRIGTYDISWVHWNSDDIYFYSQPGRNSGFVYLPNGLDQDHLSSDIILTPLVGDWYEFVTTF